MNRKSLDKICLYVCISLLSQFFCWGGCFQDGWQFDIFLPDRAETRKIQVKIRLIFKNILLWALFPVQWFATNRIAGSMISVYLFESHNLISIASANALVSYCRLYSVRAETRWRIFQNAFHRSKTRDWGKMIISLLSNHVSRLSRFT